MSSLEPPNIANEGGLTCVVVPEAAEPLLAVMHAHTPGWQVVIIGWAGAGDQRFVQMKSVFSGGRMVDRLTGEQPPRIC